MNITEACASDENPHSLKRNSESSARKYVDVLVDLSEEDSSEDNMHLLQSRTGWEDAVEGWGKCSPFPISPQQQRKGKNKTEITDSHCLLCADLKLSDLPISCPAENDLNTIKQTTPTPPDLEKKTPNTISSTSSDELYTFSQSLQNMPGPLINKLLSGDEQCTQKKTVCHHHIEPWKMLKERTVALSIRSFSVLPPVKKSKNILKIAQPAEEVTKLTMPSADKRISVRDGTGNVIKNLTDLILEGNSYRLNRSASTKNGPSQDNTQMPPTFNITFQNRFELPSSTVANILPQFSYPLGRNLRQEEFAKTSTRNDTTYRLHSAHKERDLRPEAHRLMLIGTRVRMPM